MENDKNIIYDFQILINQEFDKKFGVQLNGRLLTIAISKDEIPVISSYEIIKTSKEQIITIYFNNKKIQCSLDDNKIFQLCEEAPGKIDAIVFKVSDQGIKPFKVGREMITEIHSTVTSSISNTINVQKRKNIIHAFYDMLSEKHSDFDRFLVKK